MDENALIGLQCPNCNHAHPDTLAHLKARWQEPFRCEKCGIDMKVDREEALAAIESADPDHPLIIKMHEVS